MKKILITTILIFVCTLSFSQTRTNSEAESIINEWFTSLQINKSTIYPESGLRISDYQTIYDNSQPVFYVYNLSPSGFVLISAEQRTIPILGFNTTDNWNYSDDVSPELTYLLDSYKEQISIIRTEDIQISAYRFIPAANPKNVEALLTTNWGQKQYYNTYCPVSTTGCGATAIGQILKYHNFPTHGLGTNKYYKKKVVEADFFDTQYDWLNMPNSLSISSTPEEINAVAELLYQCGVASNMDYTSSGSGTNDIDMMYGLETYLGYNTQKFLRDDYVSVGNEVIYISLLLNEINNSKPILYGGAGTGGHWWVLDGYQEVSPTSPSIN